MGNSHKYESIKVFQYTDKQNPRTNRSFEDKMGKKKTFFKMKNTIKQPQNQLATPNQSSNFSFALCPFQFQAWKKAKEKERTKKHESSKLSSSSTSSFSYCTSHHPM